MKLKKLQTTSKKILKLGFKKLVKILSLGFSQSKKLIKKVKVQIKSFLKKLGLDEKLTAVKKFLLNFYHQLQSWAKTIAKSQYFNSLKQFVINLHIIALLRKIDQRLKISKKFKKCCLFIKDFFCTAKEGQLAWYYLTKLAVSNLRSSTSRTFITAGAITLGTGAIVVLVSFGFGLQNIVTKRLLYDNAKRIADVQSNSTALTLNKENIEQISKINGVEDYASAISAAGYLEFRESKIDVVVIAAQNKFLEYTNYLPNFGTGFSEVANQEYVAPPAQEDEISDLIEMSYQPEVLGEADSQINLEEAITGETIRFRVKDDEYLPLRVQPNDKAEILGYVRGSLLKNYAAMEVWGGQYISPSTSGRFIQDTDGQWYGRWLKATVPIHEEKAATVYVPKVDEKQEQVSMEGYLPEVNVHLLSAEEITVERQLAKIMAEEGQVLGESTSSADTTTSEATDSAEATASAITQEATFDDSSLSVLNLNNEQDLSDLTDLVKENQTVVQQTLQNQLAVFDVQKEGGKEILLSTALLETWQLEPKDVLGKTVNLEYILSGGTISGLSGKVKSLPVSYTIVGIIKDTRPVVFTPLGDLQSIGADRYSSLKVLAKDNGQLKNVREQIEAIGFTTQSLVDTLLQVEKLFNVMRFLLGSFGMIALIVAIIGMFNTLTVSLLERTREIGVMKTMGTTNADVLKLFVLESVVLGILGGILGIILGLGLGNAINLLFKLLNPDASANLFQSPLNFLIFMLILSVLIGFFTGLYPARRAKRISALNALRYE